MHEKIKLPWNSNSSATNVHSLIYFDLLKSILIKWHFFNCLCQYLLVAIIVITKKVLWYDFVFDTILLAKAQLVKYIINIYYLISIIILKLTFVFIEQSISNLNVF